MLLINGKVYDSQETKWAIDTVQKSIIETLSKDPLDIQKALSASDRLADEIISGRLDDDLKDYLDVDTLISHDIKSIASMFKADQLQRRIDLEIGYLSEKIKENHNPKGNHHPKENHGLKENHNLRIAPLGSLLHIAAGNMDALPAFSALEGLLSGNINILKLPSLDRGFSIFLLKKLIDYEPCLKDYIYVFDTPSHDLNTIQSLMNLVNAIVIWGNDETIGAVRANAPINTKIIEFGHKLSFTYLAQLEVPEDKLQALAHHIFTTKQLLCSSCQVIFLNTADFDKVVAFGEYFNSIMKEMEMEYHNPIPLQGKVSIELLTRSYERIYSDDIVFRNERSSVICVNDNKLVSSPQLGNVFVKPLPKEQIVKALYRHKSHLQTVGVYPIQDDIIDIFARVGLTNIRGIEDMSSFNPTGSHDGKFPLLEYSRIVEL